MSLYFLDTPEYVPHSYFENIVYHGMGLLGDTVVVVQTRGKQFPIDVLEPSTKTWIKGPPLNVPRTSLTVVTLNSTSIMAIGGRSGRNGLIWNLPKPQAVFIKIILASTENCDKKNVKLLYRFHLSKEDLASSRDFRWRESCEWYTLKFRLIHYQGIAFLVPVAKFPRQL